MLLTSVLKKEPARTEVILKVDVLRVKTKSSKIKKKNSLLKKQNEN